VTAVLYSEPVSTPRVNPGGEGAGATVLVVEDDPRIAALLERGLRRQGYDVRVATAAAGALDALREGGIDVHLLDLGLPDLDGVELLRHLRAEGDVVPVVVLTARTDPRDRAEVEALGVVRYLTKPFAWPDLLEAVRVARRQGT